MVTSRGGRPPDRPPETGDPITVLHVDDETGFAEMAAEFLEAETEGVEVETATSARAGLERLSTGAIDCIVSDYDMPEMDGLTFLEAVRETHPDLPFILFTGKGSEEIAGEAISKGVTDYLQKKSGAEQYTVLANRIEHAVGQRRTEDRLAESQRRFRTLLGNAPGMAYRCRNEPDWPMLFLGDGCVDLTGYEPAEIVDGEVSYGRDVMHPEDRDRVWDDVQAAVEAGEPFRVEYRIRTADGDERWLWEQGRGVRDDGETVALEGFITDVTDRRERDEQRQIYEYACASALSGIAIASLEGELQSVNPAFCEMWGCEADAVRGRPVTSFWAEPEAAEGVVTAIRETGRWEGELEAVRADGTTFDAYCRASFVTDDAGEPIALMSSFVDVTERKRRERELAEEREKYSTLIERSHDGIGIVQDEEFVFTNARLAAITGYDAKALQEMSVMDLIVPEDRGMVRDRYERRLDPAAESPPARYTAGFETSDGRRRVGEISAAPIQYEDGPADLLTVRDVTEREQYADELEQVNEELTVLNRVVRHDIRNDMAVMLGWGELLRDHVDDEGADHLEKILTSGEHVIELTEITRDYVETLTSDEAVDLEPTNLREILENEVRLRQEAHEDAEITIGGSIPDVTVRANMMLSSAFRNLLNNAVQHNDKVTPVVEVSAEERDEAVHVSVADNGPGVPAAARETIFGKGEKGLASSGTGIGLYLVRTLVEQYGGAVHVEDNDPEGAVFTVVLPKAN